MYSRREVEIERQPSARSLAVEQGVATDVAAELKRRFSQAIDVATDLDAVTAWHRNGAALGDEGVTPPLSGLDVRGRQ